METTPAFTPQQGELFAHRRANLLSELVRLFSSGKDPLDLAESAVELVAQATGAKSVFVYSWDPVAERLVLRAVTHFDRALTLHPVQMRLGEGITGWSALHRKPVLLGSNIAEDPRFFDVPTVDEQDYNSVLTVPIYDDETLYGVFAMYSEEEHAFGTDEVAIAEEVGLLLASGLKRAEIVRELELQSATAHFLVDMPRGASASLPTALRESATRVLDLLEADACIINYVAWVSMTSEPIAIAERIDEHGHSKTWLTHSKRQAREIEVRYEEEKFDQISVSLGYGVSQGVVTCFRSRRLETADIDRLNVLAAQIGVLIENIEVAPNAAAQTMALLTSDREDQMVESLRYLGWRGNGFVPILIQVKRVGVDIEAFGRSIKDSAISLLGNDTLIAQSGTLIVLLASVDQASADVAMVVRVQELLTTLEEAIGFRADIGVGQSTIRTNSIRNSLIQARGALAWASFSSTRKQSKLVAYDSIRAVRELPRLVSELGESVTARTAQLKPLIHYDGQQGTQLLETLETYALHGGSASSAASTLYIHRNTLRQRLTRINELIGENIDADRQWPTILLATRVLKLEAETS